MNPLSNSWKEPKYNGVFEPIKSYRDKRVYNKFGKTGVKIKDVIQMEVNMLKIQVLKEFH